MSQFEDDDNTERSIDGFIPGMPDPQSADSLGLWWQGLLEDPLEETSDKVPEPPMDEELLDELCEQAKASIEAERRKK